MYVRLIGPSCLGRALVVGLLAVSAWAAERSQPQDGMTLAVAEPSGPFKPGSVVVLDVVASRTLTSLKGEAWGRPVRFWPTTSPMQWRGLVGVGLDTAPGKYEVSISGTGAAEETAVARVSLRVERGQFETRRLRVAPRLVRPPEEEAARIAQETKAMAEAFATLTPERVWHGRFEVPVPGAATSSFGRLTVANGEPAGRHQGTDFRAATGTPVRAPNAGRVVLAQNLYFAGNTVILDHGLGVFSLLAHLSSIGVHVGDRVSRGHVVGESGATGRVTGPHLHWAVRFAETSVDPLSLIATLATLPDENAPLSSQ